MKNQYFGDINDYRKYGLIRLLADGGKIKAGVCWMLTPDDTRTDAGWCPCNPLGFHHRRSLSPYGMP